MKKTTKTQANGFYLFSGRANANSCFIEKILHAKQFLLYANYFFKGSLSIYDYIITKDGWTILVKIKSVDSFTDSNFNRPEDIWKVISERVRLFLSTFVRVTNKEKGRTGCLVHSGYERYFFETLQEAKECIEGIRKQQLKLYSKKRKYRGLKTHYQIPSCVGKGSVFLCSRDVRREEYWGKKAGEVFKFIDLTDLVVQKMIDFTISVHKPTKKHSSHSNSIVNTT